MIAESGGPEVGPIIPSLEGGNDWHPLSYHPQLQYVYFLSNQWAMGMKFWRRVNFLVQRTASGISGQTISST